jgi:dihydroflavonol-4-reductase
MNAQPDIPAPPAPGRVLVTGATGLLGSNVTAELLAAGTEVLALARSADRARSLLPAHERLRIVEGDITRSGGFAAHLRGVDAIIHTAAWFRECYQPGGNDPAKLQRVNVDAVERLLEAAADAEVPVMVHISSATTIGTAPAASRRTRTPRRTRARNATATGSRPTRGLGSIEKGQVTAVGTRSSRSGG